MGVDYYACANCGDTFPDCRDYFSCYACGHHFCSTKCGGRQVVSHPEDSPDMEEETTCILCRKEVATDRQKSVNQFMDLIEPHIVHCMKYKIKRRLNEPNFRFSRKNIKCANSIL